MKNYFDEICSKLNNEIEIEDIEIVDNSRNHVGHKFYSPNKFKISSSELKKYCKFIFQY